MAIDLEKYRVNKPQNGINLAKYKKTTDVFKFDVPETPEDRANKLARYQEDAHVAEEEAKKQNSIGGFLKNFGKAFVKNIAGSEVGLGQTIAKVIDAPRANEAYTQATQTSADIKTNLLKTIRENKAQGLDTSRLERAYNMQVKNDKQTEATMKPAELPTMWQAGGQIAGTALDLLTAGTYGKAKTGVMQTGKLYMPASKTVATAVGNHLASADQIIKNTTPETLAKLGGEPELIKRTATNIVDGLRAEGMEKMAEKVATINPANFTTIAAYSDEVSRMLGNPEILRGIVSTISPELGSISTQKAGGLFTKTGAKNILKGGAVGYGYDVSQGMQGGRGEDRTEGKAFIPGAGTALGVAIPAVSEFGQSIKNYKARKDDAVVDLVSPKISGKKGKKILASDTVSLTEPKMFGKGSVDFTKDPQTLKIAEASSEYVNPKKTVSHNVNAVKTGIVDIAENHVKPFLEENPVPFNFEDLQTRLGQIQPSGSLKADPSAFKTYSRVREEIANDIAEHLRKSGGYENMTDMNELWNARKVIDARINNELGDAAFGTPQYTGVKAAATDMRRAVSGFISDSIANPGQAEDINRMYEFLNEARNRGIRINTSDDAYRLLRDQMGIKDLPEDVAKAAFFKSQLEKMNLLYMARDNMLDKVKGELGKTRLQLFLEENPTTKKVLYTGGAIATGAIGLNAIGGD